MKSAPLPLAGIKVLDVSTVLAAPVTATLLGDFGAEVVKIEEPGRGDFTRAGVGASGVGARSLQWLQEGRNKQSVTIDLRTPRGQDLLRSLIPHFDIVISNFRPPTLEKWGLNPDVLRKINPRAVYVFLTGYGLTGPYRDRGAFDRIASAFSGLTFVSGERDRPPVRTGYAVIDFMGAYMSAFAAMVALRHREATGQGQIVDLALFEAGFRASEGALMEYGWDQRIRERQGHRNLGIVPASDFDTGDGRRISLHAGTDALFGKLVEVIGRPDLLQDPRFATRQARIDNQEELYAIVSDWVRLQGCDDVVRLLNDAGVPSAPVMNIADIARDPHYRERGTIVDVKDNEFGDIPMTAPLPHLSETPGRIRSLGPVLGEHNRAILGGLLGLCEEQLAELAAEGIISNLAPPTRHAVA